MITDAPLPPETQSARNNVGVCGRKFPRARELGAQGVLQRCAELGYDGVFFRTVLDVTPTLDPAVLRDCRSLADDLGLYLEMGLGKVNPFNTAEAPEVRAIGDGDYLRGMTRMIEACTDVGCRSLWVDTANHQNEDWGLFAIDRFRTDVTWAEQLAATRRFLEHLGPVLRATDSMVAIETHEEITTLEISGLADAVGHDVVGVTLDLANVVLRGEDPLEATRRVAPLVRQTHMRDIVLFPTAQGLERQVRACGDGLIDWPAVLSVLLAAAPEVNLTIENAGGHDGNYVPLDDPAWQAAQPGVPASETAGLRRLAADFQRRLDSTELPAPNDYFTITNSHASQEEFLARSARTLRSVMHDLSHAKSGGGKEG